MTDTILNQPDPAFPAGSGDSIPAIRALYRRAKRGTWDPGTAVPWALFDGTTYSAEVRWAARIYWSGRAWGEYGAISESPALQLRYDLDELEPELSLFWALRTQEEARHAEASAQMADLLGGYLADPSLLSQGSPPPPERREDRSDAPHPDARPPETQVKQSVSPHVPHLGTRARALAPEIPVEATIAGLVCVAETVAYDVFLDLLKHLRDPVAKAIFRLIVRDEVRHCEFGWAYLAHRQNAMRDTTRAACAQAMSIMVQEIELGGYRSPWLDPGRNPALVESERIVFEAGLGGTIEEWEGPVLVTSIRKLRARAATLGIDLPTFHHAKLGTI